VKDGKLSLVTADGFRLAVLKLDFDGDEGQVLISRDELSGVTSVLRKAKRVRLNLEKSGDNLDGLSLVLDTELIRYKWRGTDGSYPDYEKLIPSDFNTVVSFDTGEAITAVSSLKALSDSQSYAVDLNIGNGKVVMSNPDNKGQVEIPADTQGELKVRIDGAFFTDTLKACGGIVELKLTDSTSPMLFTVDGYEVMVMPMFAENNQPKAETPTAEAITSEARQPAETAESTETEAKTTEPAVEETDTTQAVAEAEKITKEAGKPKPKRNKAKEPVAVA
jgi:DNA polymerase III sliding clamp (beta) subunit (PCNA family)